MADEEVEQESPVQSEGERKSQVQAQGDLKPVRVLIRQIDYVTTGIDPLGNEVDVIKTAYGPGMPENDPSRNPELDPESQEYADKLSDYQNGELVHLLPHAYVGLITSHAVRDVEVDDSGEEVQEDEELLDVDEADEEDLATWIRQENPTVNDVVQASQGDPELARKLLEAERIAREPDSPRKGVTDGLSAVISRGGQ